MKILQVIHGYPMRYNAGSEVYTQTLCHGLVARGHEVHVFTREEDSFAPDFAMRGDVDPDDARIRLHVVNHARSRDRYRHAELDAQFGRLLDELRPDIVHIGHLNHLSTSLVFEAARRSVPVVYTLHDYWLMCPRGQFMQMHPEDPDNLWAACDGQDDRKCADRCYARYYSGDSDDIDAQHWTNWVGRRMAHVREVVEHVDLFLAPARYLHDRFHRDFGLPLAKLQYLDYGFDRSRLTGRQRVTGEPLTFGYIGTHIPAKGIHVLIEAFARLQARLPDGPRPRLRIWGRPRGQDTDALRRLAVQHLGPLRDLVEWLPEYRNQEIVQDVFNRVDVIVVPSVWVENSPLVIHEAQEVRVPVITADVGGMGEYVAHGQNGLQFRHRDVASLTEQLLWAAQHPVELAALGRRGYLFSENGTIPDLNQHAEDVERCYLQVLAERQQLAIEPTPGPWRITFDTNPDDCNYACIMCEEHSPHSQLQIQRRTQGRGRRRMPLEWIERIVAEQAGRGLREIIPSTMGEPLLYEHFDAILDLCHKYSVLLNLTTNGSFPGRSAKDWAERIVPVTSDVKVSWNGATKATHEAIMLHSRWEQVLANVRTLIAVRDQHAAATGHRCRVTFQLTFIERNVAELPDIVRLAAQLGVDRVKGHQLWVHGVEMADQSLRRSPEAVARWNQAVELARQAAEQHRLPSGERVLLENFVPLAPAGQGDAAAAGKCPFLMQEAWVSAEGRFSPCCAPDALRRTLGDFGTVEQRSLQDIWESDQYRTLASTWSTRHLCLGCTMRKPLEVQP